MFRGAAAHIRLPRRPAQDAFRSPVSVVNTIFPRRTFATEVEPIAKDTPPQIPVASTSTPLEIPKTTSTATRIFDPTIPPAALIRAPTHPRTHSVPVALLHLRSSSPEILSLFSHFALHAAYAFGIPVSHTVALPTQRSLYTVLKSPFVHKKAQENFERKISKRAIKAWDADGEVVGKWIRYLELHAIGGIGMRVVRWERAEVGFGKNTLEKAVSGLRVQMSVEEQVKEAADKIAAEEMKAAGLDGAKDGAARDGAPVAAEAAETPVKVKTESVRTEASGKKESGSVDSSST